MSFDPGVLKLAPAIGKIPLRLLVSTLHGFYIIDFQQRESILFHYIKSTQTSGFRPRYFGMTWNEDYIYLASSPDNAREPQERGSKIIVTDRQGNQIGSFAEDIGVWDMHQIQMVNGKLWICDTGNNTIREFTPDGVFTRFVQPHGTIKAAYGTGWHDHFNSIYIGEDDVYVIGNQYKTPPSKIWKFKGYASEMVWTAGNHAHNLFSHEEHILTCSSNECAIVDELGKIYWETGEKTWFLRGVAKTEEYIIIGGTPMQKEREKRKGGTCRLHVLDNNFKKIGRMDLLFQGQILDVRVLDVKDYAHDAPILSL